ncbi:hypothetical protein GGC64_005902 [Mycobacterium sp. OAS707]|nr:hypothetical protein [Mycobacterium sp. OAS707]
MDETLVPDGAFGTHRFGAALTSASFASALTFRVKERVGVLAAASRRELPVPSFGRGIDAAC